MGDESLVGDESLLGDEILSEQSATEGAEPSSEELLKASLSGVGLTEVGGEVPMTEPNPNAVPPEQLSLFGTQEPSPKSGSSESD